MTTVVAALLVAVLQAGLPMRPIDKGQDSELDAGRQVMARTVGEWSALWTQHAGRRTRPNAEFSTEVVVGVFLGSRPSTGFGVEIVRVREEGVVLVVSYRETRPAPGVVTAQILTSPYHVVAVPKGSTTDVKFERVN